MTCSFSAFSDGMPTSAEIFCTSRQTWPGPPRLFSTFPASGSMRPRTHRRHASRCRVVLGTGRQWSCAIQVRSLVRPEEGRPPLPSLVVTPARRIRGSAVAMISAAWPCPIIAVPAGQTTAPSTRTTGGDGQTSSGLSTASNVAMSGSLSAVCVRLAAGVALCIVAPAGGQNRVRQKREGKNRGGGQGGQPRRARKRQEEEPEQVSSAPFAMYSAAVPSFSLDGRRRLLGQ